MYIGRDPHSIALRLALSAFLLTSFSVFEIPAMNCRFNLLRAGFDFYTVHAKLYKVQRIELRSARCNAHIG
jgi:hypothetical protein